MKPGIYEDISNEDYHGGDGLSSSGLKLILDNPAMFEWEYLKGNKEPPAAHFAIGTLVHDMVLEEGVISKHFAVMPNINRRTNAGKAEYAEFLEANKDKDIVTQDQLDEICDMADSILGNLRVRRIIEGSKCEHSIYWMEDDLLAKCRPDSWRPDISLCADLKTAASARYADFQRNAIKMGYHVSASWYLKGIFEQTGERMNTWAWIVVEKKAPYSVVTYTADPELLAKGDELCSKAIDTYKRCVDQGHWPQYQDEVKPILLPSWAA